MENTYLLSGFSFENEEQYNKFKNILIKNNYLNYKQKEEIYNGLIDNLDIELYISPNYDSEVMNIIRKALKDNLNITHLLKNKNRYDKYELLKNIYQLQIKNKINLSDKILNKITDLEKLTFISKWTNEGLDNNTFIENKLYKFKIFSVYITDPVTDYLVTNFNDKDRYTNFLNNLVKKSIYNFGVNVDKDDKIL